MNISKDMNKENVLKGPTVLGKVTRAPIETINKQPGGQTMVKKVLVVDDSELIHSMYKLILKKYSGCETLKAMNGKEALDILSHERNVDIILLDINMPIMNGIQFLEVAKKQPSTLHIPVIIISTEGKEEDTLRGLGLGAAGYIVKPFKSSQLHQLIETIVSKVANQTT